jgi:DNA-binding NarL/FixJ family response regulator
MIRVLIADDHPAVRHGLQHFINDTNDIECVATAENGAEAITQTLQHNPDVIIMDIQMPILDGITATTLIKNRYPNTHIIILSGETNPHLQQQAKNAGATTYLQKHDHPHTLLTAIRTAAATRL